jgi:hypothetical protein
MPRPWRYALSSVIGTSHVASGDPCQDASLCAVISAPSGAEVLVAVASDGAGSAKLSQVGSAETCRFVLERMRSLVSDGGAISSISSEIATTIVLEAQANLRTAAQMIGAQARDLACTLVTGVLGEDGAAFFQVGDGVAIVGPRGEPENEFSWIFWPERGEYANTTCFLCDERVAEHVQHAAVPNAIDEVALLTDGIQNLVLDYKQHAAHAPFFRRMMEPLRAVADVGHVESLSAALSRYLGSAVVNDRTDDDKTLILASRRSTSQQ